MSSREFLSENVPVEAKTVTRWSEVKDISVFNLSTWCWEHQLDPANVIVSYSHLHWQAPETDEEREIRERRIRDANERTERWEQEALPRLAVKYGYVLVPKDEDTRIVALNKENNDV